LRSGLSGPWLPQLLAGFDVEKRHDKEDRGEKQHREILHQGSSVQAGLAGSNFAGVPDSSVDIQFGGIESAEGKSKEKIKINIPGTAAACGMCGLGDAKCRKSLFWRG
jgi:hypothetical protein